MPHPLEREVHQLDLVQLLPVLRVVDGIERRPPESITSRWALAVPPSAERYRWIRNRIMAVAAVVVVVLGLGGVVAWRLTGNADYLIAGLAYGLLLAGGVIGGVVLAKRRIATDVEAASRRDGR